LRDAMRFVDGEERNLGLLEEREEALVVEALGRHVEELQLTLNEPRGNAAVLVGAEGRIEARRRNPDAREKVDLVLHQRDERRDDDRHAVEQYGGKLVAERLARARREHCQGALATEDRVDNGALALPEGREAEGASKRLFRLRGQHFRAFRRGQSCLLPADK